MARRAGSCIPAPNSNLQAARLLRNFVPRPSVTRREILQLGAGAAALAVVPAPVRAATCEVPVFEMDLTGAGGAAAATAGWLTLPPVRAPRRFDMVGMRWRRARELRVQVRARRRSGEWSRWTELHGHGDHGPDAERAVPGTEPAWTGPADLLQVRLRGDVRGLRARFVHAAPGARTARASSAPGRARPAQGLRIITRAEWGADGCKPRTSPTYGEVQAAFVHHTVSANDYSAGDSAAIVLGICRYHRDSNGWNDVGYNFLVDKYGQVFEGRAGGIDQAVVGAQAQGYNSVSTGVACIGDFSSVVQSEAGLDALARLIGWKLSVHGVPAEGQVTVTSAGGASNRYPQGARVTLERISGHRDGCKTACPGNALYGQLDVVRQRAAAYAVPVSSLSMTPESRRVPHGTPVGVSGTLRFGDGSSPAGAAVQVEHRRGDGAWRTLATAIAATDGSWRATVEPETTGRLRARFAGDATRPPLSSPSVRVKLTRHLTLELSSRSVARGERVDVTGTVGPDWPPRVRLVFQRRVGSRWVSVQRKRINVRGGRFSSHVRPPGPGVYRVKIKTPGAVIRRRFRVTELTGGASAGRR